MAIKPENEKSKVLEYCSNILEKCRNASQEYTAEDLKNALLSFSTFLMKDDEIKLDHWASSFNSNKWRGYIFVSDKIDKSIAFEVSERLILKGKAKLKNPMAYLKDIDY